MKNYRLLTGIIIFSSIVILDSCKKDNNNTPQNPTADVRDKYTGTWHCFETDKKDNTTRKFDVTISTDQSNSSKILMANFYELVNTTAYAIVADPKVNIPSQKISNFTISGDGTFVSNTKITWTYTVNDGADITPYSADFTK